MDEKREEMNTLHLKSRALLSVPRIRGSLLVRGESARPLGSQAIAASAKDVIVRYYDAYNAGDIDTIDSLLSEDCSYHDMIYEEPFKGRCVAPVKPHQLLVL